MRLATFLGLCLFSMADPLLAADWKPAPSPLMTRWGRELNPAKVWAEYPRPQMVRKDWLNLNGLWDYAITPKGSERPSKWDGQILVPFAVESALSGVGKHVSIDQALWYRRTVTIPDGWNNQRILVHFDAVDWETTVWINGKKMEIHRGMSDPFSFDITDAMNGKDAEIVVRVWDPTDAASQPRGKQVARPNGIWYTPVTGIWQSVWMEPVASDASVRSIRVTPDIAKGEVEFVVDVAGDANSVLIGYKPKEASGLEVKAKGKPGEPIRMKVENPKLWTPESPHLYEVSIYLTTHLRDSAPADMVDTYFAMRSITMAKDEAGIPRMMLNGKPVFQVGPLDQGWWPDGLLTPPSEAAMIYDLDVLKKLGFNMLRKHIKVEPSRYYYHCDKIGLLVWQDMPSGFVEKTQFVQPNSPKDAVFTAEDQKQFRAELKAMIDHLRFFPCIVVWVPFNEGWGQHNTNDTLKWVKEYDQTRLVNGPSGWTDRGYGDMKDMHNYPGPGMFPAMADRISVLGEFGGLGLPLKGHLWKDQGNWGYRTLKSTEELRGGYQQLIQRLRPLIARGLSAAVYTQTTDVEIEVNGLLTYDRDVLKLDPVETAKWHAELHRPAPIYVPVVPTSEKKAQPWQSTLSKPGDGWNKPDYDDTRWKNSAGGFGTKGTPGAVIGTEWNASEIWLRRRVEVNAEAHEELWLRVHHDEDAEVYLNGILAARLSGFSTEYQEVPISAEARKAIGSGPVVIAVHCRQTAGGQYIDVGIVKTKPAR